MHVSNVYEIDTWLAVTLLSRTQRRRRRRRRSELEPRRSYLRFRFRRGPRTSGFCRRKSEAFPGRRLSDRPGIFRVSPPSINVLWNE